jgi:glycosyltransferase involved in cell wall biosynthesis
LGHVPHGDALLREYEEADVFVHPSRKTGDGSVEGLPSTILEAMACGLPVVSTQHGGIPYAVTKDVGALVAEREPTSLAREIVGLLQNDARARAMGSAGRERVAAHFNLKRQVSRLEDMYDEVVSG